MLPASDDGSYASTNHHKYARGGPIYRAFLGRFQETLAGLVASFRPESVLDAGCGEGFVAAGLKRRLPGLRIAGIDADPRAVAYARAHHGAVGTFETASVYDLPFPQGSFDVVLCSEVLEHLETPARALAELRRVARVGVVVTVPREPYFEALSRLGRLLGTAPDPGHVQHWTRRSFERFLAGELEDPAVTTCHVFLLASARVRPEAGRAAGEARHGRSDEDR